MTDRDSILEDLQHLCCENACLLHHFSVDSILGFTENDTATRVKNEEVMLRRYTELAYFLVNGKIFWRWQIDGHKICEKAFTKIWGCSYYKLSNAKQSRTEDSSVHGNSGKTVLV